MTLNYIININNPSHYNKNVGSSEQERDFIKPPHLDLSNFQPTNITRISIETPQTLIIINRNEWSIHFHSYHHLTSMAWHSTATNTLQLSSRYIK